MSKPQPIKIGYEVGTDKPVSVPLAHTFVTGQTQVSGKTTTLQAIVARSECRALAFVTKRGEELEGRRIRPYLPREGEQLIHWRFVETIMASALGQRALKYERLQIINAAKDARSLDDVRANITRLQVKAKGPAADIYTLLGEYLDLVLPEMRALKASPELELLAGLNVMDLTGASPEMQALAIGAAIGQINEAERGVLTVFPEAWQFAPRDRNTAAKFQAEKMARMGAAVKNFLLCDSQDIVSVSPVVRQASTVWIVGVQGEANELRRMLDVIKSKGIAAPKPSEVATLDVGQFYVCHGRTAVKTYVQPTWLSDAAAVKVSLGGSLPVPPAPTKSAASSRSAYDLAQTNRTSKHPTFREDEMSFDELNRKLDLLLVQKNTSRVAQMAAPAPGVSSETPALDEEALYQRFLVRLQADLPRAGGPIVVTPPAKLRKDFQREESARIVLAANELKALAKRILKFVEAVDGFTSQREMAKRLGRSLGGGAMADMSKAVKELSNLGFVNNDNRNGVGKKLRETIVADLANYQPTEAEIEAVYQNVLHSIATAAD